MKALVASIAALCLLAPVRERDDGKKDDAVLIRGTWKMVSALDGGEPQPDMLAWRVVIGEERLTLGAGKAESGFTYKLDPDRMPKQLDLTAPNRVLRAIYRLNGDDLTICLNERPGGERPTAFESRLNSPNDVLLVLKRVR
jgi:uncharacterized protein (TIGR03067 family)